METANFLQVLGPYSCSYCEFETEDSDEALRHYLEIHLKDAMAGKITPRKTTQVSTAYLDCQKRCQEIEREYDELRRQIEKMTTVGTHNKEYAPEGSCLAFLRWEALRRTQELQAEKKQHPIRSAIKDAKLEGFQEAVKYLAKCPMAYYEPVAGEIS